MRDFPLGDLSRPVPDFAATLRKPLAVPLWGGAKNTDTTQGRTNGSRRPRYYSNLPSPSEDVEQMSFPPSPPSGYPASYKAETAQRSPISRTRYYSHALSDQDKEALAMGVKNDNLKEWASTDLLQYQDSRIELVPYCENRIEILTAIAQEKRCSEHFLLQIKNTRQFLQQLFKGKIFHTTQDTKVRPPSGLPPVQPYPVHIGTYATYTDGQAQQHALSRPDVTQSMIDLRLPNPGTNTPPTRPSNLAERPASFGRAEEPLSRKPRVRPASNGDYFTGRHGRHSSTQSRNSSLSTESSSRLRSPLAHEYKADVTFDAFLAPHKSGKGETFRDKEAEVVTARESHRRTLSKIPSMPNMRKRLSKYPSRNPLDE